MNSSVVLALLLLFFGDFSTIAECASSPRASSLQYVYANTTLGPLRGVQANHSRVFRGIPFAASTAPPNRFQPPQPAQSWTDVKDAINYGPGCPQSHGKHNPDVPGWQSEDCLNLNVWAPVDAVPGNPQYPVIVWIYGGGFAEGGATAGLELGYAMYDGAYMSSYGKVVVVTLNYRVGVLGFMVTSGNVTGNFGIEDQRAALRWVQANIAAFGGNPDNVVIAGESAGAMSVGIHLTSPASKGLFHAAIMESNPMAWQYRDRKHASVVGDTITKALGCSTGSGDLECLQKGTTEQVIEAGRKGVNAITFLIENWGHFVDGLLPWGPIVTGQDDFPMQPLTAFAEGKAATNVPVIIGTNANEGVTFVYSAVHFNATAVLGDIAEVLLFGTSHGIKYGFDVLKEYPNPNSEADARVVLSKLFTDYMFACASRRMAEFWTGHGGKAWLYEYDHVISFGELWKSFNLPACVDKVCHASELVAVWHQHFNYSFTPAESQMSDQFVGYWTSFAHNHQPAPVAPGAVQWTTFDNSTMPKIIMETPAPKVVDTVTDAVCKFWDALRYDF